MRLSSRLNVANARIRQPIGVALVLFAYVGLLVGSVFWHSPTLNEPGHLLAGCHYWRTGDFSLYRVNPPLVRLVASAPVVLVGYEYEWEQSGYYEHAGARPVFDMAEQFIKSNGRRSLTLIRLARLACIPFSILGAVICFLWARDLFGACAGLFACSLWCFSPMVLAHCSFIAPDAHATAVGLAACYTFWRWLRKPTWKQAMLTGVVLGLAELSKTTMVLFYPLWPLLWLAYRWPDRKSMTVKNWRDEAGMLALRMVIGLYVLNLGYLGQGSFTQLKDFEFVSQMLTGNEDHASTGNRFEDMLIGKVPVPLPAHSVIGIDIQQRDFEDFSRPSYLRGHYQAKGWWYYYLYAILVKTPLGTLGLGGITLVAMLFQLGPRIRKRDAMILLSPAIVIFCVASSKSGFSHHSRYVLPCIPFLFIWFSGLVSHLSALTGSIALGLRIRVHFTEFSSSQLLRCVLGVATFVCLFSTLAASFSAYPSSMSFFNRLAGGSKNGAEHLLNSNIDWGQDLLNLERWVKDQGDDQPVHLAFYNYYNPFDLEIEGTSEWPFRKGQGQPETIPEGRYAISVNLLYDFPWPIRDRDGSRHFVDLKPLAYLRSIKPIGRAGDSIRIFSAGQMRDAYDSPPAPPLWAGFEDD